MEIVMKTESHWEECKQLGSYHAAQNLCLQLQELAKDKGYNPRGIKVRSKRDVYSAGEHADSQVIWKEGPAGWPSQIQINEIPGICLETNKPFTVSFYDILLPMASGI